MHDVIVAGLGGMGSAAAYHLAGRGKRVLGLERHAPAHDKGSSHGESRIIRQAYFEDPAYVPLLLRAYELWEQLEEETGEDLMTLNGGLMIGPPEASPGLGQRRERRRARPALRDPGFLRAEAPLPDLRARPERVALYEEKAGFVRPEAGVKAHLDRAASLGAELRFEERITSWEPTASGVRVETERGSYEAERLVVSAGAWAGELLADLGLPLEVTRQILFWFRPEGRVEPFAPEKVPYLDLRARRRQHVLQLPCHRRRGHGEGRVLPGRRQTGRPRDDRPRGTCRGGRVHPGLPRPVRPFAERRPRHPRRPACTPTPPTSTSSSPRTPSIRRSLSQPASRGTATSSAAW